MPANEAEPLLGAPEDPAGQQRSSRLRSTLSDLRKRCRRYFSSKWGHYSVILLVAVDILCIFADFMIHLYLCERECRQPGQQFEGFYRALEALDIVTLVISCLFMGELIANFWVFGISYLSSWFHRLDAAVILAGFVLDVCLRGILQEVGATIVVLRLWRVFQIVEEFSAGAEEQMDALHERIDELGGENRQLKEQIAALRVTQRRPT